MKLGPVLDALLAVGAATRLTRFIVTEDLGGWWVREPARRWADGSPWPAPTWRHKAVSGLECPFCVGTWLHIGGQAVNLLLPGRGPWRTGYRVLAGGLTASWLMGHVGSRLGDAGYADDE